jgi:type IV pilus assembly protein PilC
MALEALLSAGVTITEAWELAAEACGSPALKQRIRSWRPMVEAGRTHSEALNESSEFPHIFTNQYTTGEVSGTLDETLRRMTRYFQEEGSRKLHAVAQWTPRAAYLLIVMMIAYRVLQFWMGYFRQIQEIGNF